MSQSSYECSSTALCMIAQFTVHDSASGWQQVDTFHPFFIYNIKCLEAWCFTVFCTVDFSRGCWRFYRCLCKVLLATVYEVVFSQCLRSCLVIVSDCFFFQVCHTNTLNGTRYALLPQFQTTTCHFKVMSVTFFGQTTFRFVRFPHHEHV